MFASQKIRPFLFLDYGADAIDAEDAACEICERGMRFKARWQFSVGAVLHIAFAFEEGASQRVEVEGLVADCLRVSEKEYQTTVAFMDLPKELRANLGKVSTRLAFHQADAKA